MSISVNGHSTVPPGFRFHPTEDELLAYYLRKKVASEHIDLNVIRDIDLNKLEPWDIQEKCRIGTTPQNDWYFFSHKDKKYPTGTRTNRATAAGFWKATGRDKVIYTSFKRIGMRKTLVFYKGRAPHGQKSDWIMHEYRLDELYDSDSQSNSPNVVAENQFVQEEGWVICRVFKKKSHHRLSVDPTTCSPLRRSDSKPPHIVHSTSDSSLDQILQYKTAKSDGHHHYGGYRTRNPQPMDTLLSRATTLIHERFTKLPPLGSPATAAVACCQAHPVEGTDGELSAYNSRETGFGDWTVLDRLVSYDLDAYPFCPPTSRFLGDGGCGGGGGDDGDLWSLTRSATLSGSAHVSYVSHDK